MLGLLFYFFLFFETSTLDMEMFALN